MSQPPKLDLARFALLVVLSLFIFFGGIFALFVLLAVLGLAG